MARQLVAARSQGRPKPQELHLRHLRAPAHQGHRSPCRRTAQERACQRPCPRRTNPSDNSSGHVSSLVQELHGLHKEPQDHGHATNVVQEVHDAARPAPPHHPGATTLEGVSPIIGLTRCTCSPWVAPDFTSQAHKGRDLTGF